VTLEAIFKVAEGILKLQKESVSGRSYFKVVEENRMWQKLF